MENNEKRDNRTKRILIIALILALLACSFGFAALSKSVDLINNAADDNFVFYRGGVLSISPSSPKNGIVKPSSYGGANAEPATLTENGIININVHFTLPGQSATYSFYGVNKSELDSYLNTVIFGDKICKALDGMTEEEANAECDKITMSIVVKDDVFNETNGLVDNHKLASNSNEPISVVIKYKGDNGERGPKGSFAVDFGISTITYSNLD